MKTLITIIARMAIIVLALFKVGLFSFLGDISFTNEMSFERQRFLTDSLRKVAEPTLKQAEMLASQDKYTTYMYFDDMTRLMLIEEKAGIRIYSGGNGAIQQLWALSYKNGILDKASEIKAAQDKFLLKIDPNHGKDTPLPTIKEILLTLLTWFLKWYLIFFPFALLWYFTQLYADTTRIRYLRANPLKTIGMLFVYPYTLFWGILRKTSDSYDYMAVATELQRRGVKANHKEIKEVWENYKNSRSKNLQIFLGERGLIVKQGLVLSFLMASLSCISLGKAYLQSTNTIPQSVESSRDGPSIEENLFEFYGDYASQDDHFLKFEVIEIFLSSLVYLVHCCCYTTIKLLSGFPPGIGHVPLEKVNFIFCNFYLTPIKHEKIYLNNNNVV